MHRLPSHQTLDDLNYICLSLVSPLLTLGIITGSVWAEYAWVPTGNGSQRNLVFGNMADIRRFASWAISYRLARPAGGLLFNPRFLPCCCLPLWE
jgi:hypothetical protein